MDMQNVSNLRIPEGDVRTIHDKDNRLLWGKTAYSVKYAGDTFQQIYSGVQLLTKDGMATPYTDGDYWSLTAGASNTNLGDGWGRWAHTGNTTWVNVMPKMSAAISGGTYKTSTVYTILFEWRNASNFDRVTISQPGNAQDPFDGEVATVSIQLAQVSGTSKIVLTTKSTLTDSMLALRMFFTKHTASGDANIDIRVTIVEGDYSSSDLQWQPYTGNTSSPNPDYPQDIQVATGEQTVRIIGKNYLNLIGVTSNGVTGTMNADGSFTLTGKATATGGFRFGSNETPYLPAGTYTFTIGEARGSNVALVINDGNENITVRITPGNTSATVTTASAAVGMGLFVSVTNGVTYNETFKLQLTAGSAPDYDFESYQNQSYTIGLGSTELCKIDSYQDYVYKSGEDWYIHREVGKIAMSTLDDWGGSNGDFFRTGFAGDYNFEISRMLTNISTFSSTTWESGKFGITSSGNLWISTGDTTLTGDSLPTWLENKNAILYGILATPANTKITDVALISQLNAVHQWATRYGYNATVSGDLPIVLRRDSLQ